MKNYLFFTILLCGYVSISQEYPSAHENIKDQFARSVNVPNTPEAEAFAKYGEVDVNLHSGQPNISVPLHSITGREMDLPISLSYDASGIKVSQIATNVGLGWNLNVGGRVSRQVRGLPDRWNSLQGNGYTSPADAVTRAKIIDYRDFHGTNYLDMAQGSTFEQGKTNFNNFIQFMTDVSDGKIDVEQDYFSVNVLGVNETIWLDTATHQPVCLTNPNILVEAIYAGTNPIVGWKITDEQGNQYFFGNYPDDNSGNPDYPFNINTETNPVENVKRLTTSDTPNTQVYEVDYRSSWLINRIISKNGKDIYDFQYTTNTTYNNPEIAGFISGATTHIYKPVTTTTAGLREYYQSNSNTNVSDVRSIFQQQFVSTIYHNGKQVVNFDFGDRIDMKQGYGDDKSIDSFSIYEDYTLGDTAIKTVDFNYSHFGVSVPSDPLNYYKVRHKLDGIDFKTSTTYNSYSFDYIDSHLLPWRTSKSQDVLGYFNNKSNSSLYEELILSGSATGDYTITGADRSVNNQESTHIGSLNKITYPTGGYSEFTYENHTDGTNLYAGQRIKSIHNYTDTAVLATSKSYVYADDVAGVTSSLIENYSPLLNIEISMQQDPSKQTGCINPFEVSNPKILYRYTSPPNLGTHPYITYDSVYELRMDNNSQNGYTHYEFYNDPTNGWIAAENTPPYAQGYSNVYQDGKIKKSVTYRSGDLELSSEENIYEQAQSYYDKAIVFDKDLNYQHSYFTLQNIGNQVAIIDRLPYGISFCERAINITYCDQSDIYCRYDYFDQLAGFRFKPVDIYGYVGATTSMTKKEFTEGQEMTTTTTNTYSPTRKLLTASETTLGMSEKIRTEYTYPILMAPIDRTDAEEAMVTKNDVTTPVISKYIKVQSGGSQTLLSTERTAYKEWTSSSGNEYLLPEFIQTEKGGLGDSLENRISYNDIDDYGNITDVSLINGASVSYLWGYSGQYPIAKIENATSSEVASISYNSNLLDNPTSQADVRDQIQLIRAGLPNAQVTTYTYEPMIGLTSTVDPKGYLMTYHYDEHNRLLFVKDSDGNVLSKNEYNYRIN